MTTNQLTKKEYKEMLLLEEVWSIEYADCVVYMGVRGIVGMGGEVIDPDPTRATLRRLFKELAAQEGF